MPNWCQFMCLRSNTSSTFSPVDRNGFVAWYRADSSAYSDNFGTNPPGTPCINNDEVISWKDFGIPNDSDSFGGVPGTTGIFKTGIQNGLPGILFTGGDKSVTCTSNFDNLLDGATKDMPWSFFAVLKPDFNGSAITCAGLGSDAGAGLESAVDFVTILTDGSIRTLRNTNDGQGNRTILSQAGVISTGTSYIIDVLFGKVITNTVNIHVNGTNVNTATFEMSLDISPGSAGEGRIGAGGDFGISTNPFSGHIMEMIVYNSHPYSLDGDITRQLTKAYLSNKYGIPVA